MRPALAAPSHGLSVIYGIALLALAGCGGGQSAQLNARDAATLHRDVENARVAAAAGLAHTARAALDSLRRDANRLAAQGALSPADTRALAIQVSHAEVRVSAEVQQTVSPAQAPQPPAPTSTGAAPAPSSAGNADGNAGGKAKDNKAKDGGKAKDKAKGKDNGHGNGNGGGGGGD